jgi:hypothetical protein
MRFETKFLILFIFILFFSCSKPVVEKPELLIQEDKMIEMLTDIHLAEATFNARRHRDSLVMKSSSADFYYSILDKHQVPDSVFEQSFVFYASQPRKFEKMYRQAMNRLNEMDQEYSGRSDEQQELELQRNQR